jgi:hypothetical protein
MSQSPDEAKTNSNVVRYERRDNGGVELNGAPGSGELIFIDESTEPDSLPSPLVHLPFERRKPSGDDILYIGPE